MTDLSKIAPAEIQSLIVHNQDLKLDIVENMEKYGGSFVKALAECIRRADRNNLIKLVEAFWVYFIEYQPSKWGAKK